MADRMPQYQMNSLQNFISQQHMQQQSQQQQQQQQQQQDPQMVPGLPNPEHSRMWTQMQNNYRAQPNGDANSVQMNSQMADLARNQGLGHHSQGPLVQQIQQQFGLASAQRVPPSASSFHDPQSSNPSSIIPPNFPSMPMNTPQMKPSNPIQAQASRPLHPMDRPPNQQNQHPPQSVMPHHMQQQMGAQPGSSPPNPSDMFSSSNMTNVDAMHNSPHLAAQPLGAQMGHPNMRAAPASKVPTLAELMQRRDYLQSAINSMEQNIQGVLAQTRGFPDEQWTAKLEKMRTELHNRKTLFLRVNQAIQLASNTPGILGANLVHLGGMAPAAGRPGVTQGGGAPQQPWPQSSSPASNFGMNTGASGPSQIPTPGQAHPMNPQLSGQGGQMQRPAAVPPRSGSTPQQLPTGMSNTMPQNMAPFNPPSAANGQIPNRMVNLSTLGVSPLDKSHFDAMYTSFCKNRHVEPNVHVLLPDGRSVDLHNLHVQVFREGGAQFVTQRDWWAAIGGRMGFVQFPGTDTEPAKSGPGIAQQLAHTYKEHLQDFESMLVFTVRSRAAQKNNLSQNGAQNNVPGSASGEMAHSVMRPPLNPQAMANAARFVHMSVGDMRANGLPKQTVALIDRHRSDIMRWHQHSRLMATKANQQVTNHEAPGEQSGMSTAHQGGFSAQMSTAGPSLVPAPQRGQPSMMPNGMQPSPMTEMKPVQSGGILPLSQEQITHAMTIIHQTKHIFTSRLQTMQLVTLPDDQRMEYNQLMDQVQKMTRDLDGRLPMYWIVLRADEMIRRLVAIVLTVAHQRTRFPVGSPQVIIGFQTLKSMYTQIQKANEEYEQRLQLMKAVLTSQQMGGHSGPHINRPPPPPPPSQPTPPQTLQPPPAISRHPSANQSHPPSHPQPHPPMVKKPPRVPPSPSVPAAIATISAVPSPTPPPAPTASTAPTPLAAASPQTPKSPKSKPPKAKGQRVPKQPTASPSEPPAAFSPGVKRQADEDVSIPAGPSTQPESMGAPSPKKVKTEDWEGEPSEGLAKRHQEVENINTDEDANAFMDKMKELVAMTASTDAGVYDDIAHTLDRILQGAAQDPTHIATSAFASSIGGPLSELSPPAAPNDAFLEFHEFIDYSRFTTLEDEEDSKAPTPDLVPSSTNPSPQSNPDADQSQGASSPGKTKIEEPRESNHLDILHMGAFKEIDGGESAYYQASDWKWDSVMPALDQPWAIYQTS